MANSATATDAAPDATPARGARTVVDAALAGGLGAFSALLPFLMKPWFYFIDDRQHYFLPTSRDIGAMLHRGDFPWLSLNIWQAGNYTAEFQQGLFNPLTLALHYLAYLVPDQYVAGLIWTVPYLVLTAVGAFLLARELGASRGFAWVAAFCASSNNYLVYWNAASWHIALAGFAWFPLAAFCLLRVRESAGYLVGLAVCVYMGITGGSPQGAIAFVVLGVAAVAEVGLTERRWAEAAIIGAAMTAGALLAAPSYMPLAEILSESVRPSAVSNGTTLVPPLSDVLNLSTPSYVSYITFGFPIQPHLSTVPHFFVAWFILPLLPLIRWSSSWTRRAGFVTSLVAAAIFLLMSLGPEHIGPLRWPVRFVPYFQILVLVLFLAVASEKDVWVLTRKRVVTAIAVMFLGFLFAWQQAPHLGYMHRNFLLITGLSLALALSLMRRRSGALALWLLASSAGLFWLTHDTFEKNRFWQDWNAPRYASEGPGVRDLNRSGDVVRYSLFAVRLIAPADTNQLAEHRSGAIFLLEGDQALNGYSPVGHRGLTHALCMEFFGAGCPQSVRYLLGVDKETSRTMADLMRVDRVVLDKEAPAFLKVEPLLSDWRLAGEGKFTRVFERDLPATDLPGTVSFVPAGVHVSAAERDGPAREVLTLSSDPGSGGGRIVFARLWWPGYQARLNGVPILTEPHRGVLVSAMLPAGAEGTLELRYVPAGLMVGLALAGGGVLLLASALALAGRRSPSASRETPKANAVGYHT